MRGNALDGLGASIMTKYFNKTELVSMPLHGLSLSKAKKAKKKHYLCFNALARAKSITEWKHWTFPKKSFNALTRAKPILRLMMTTMTMMMSFNALTRAKPIATDERALSP